MGASPFQHLWLIQFLVDGTKNTLHTVEVEAVRVVCLKSWHHEINVFPLGRFPKSRMLLRISIVNANTPQHRACK
jgi:hypothetical protein